MKRVGAFGELREGLYLLQPTNFKPSLNSVKKFVPFSKGSNSSFFHVSYPVLTDDPSNVSLWHMRLGHFPLSTI